MMAKPLLMRRCVKRLKRLELLVEPKAILGYLDDRPSPFEYVVTPVLALIEKPKKFVLNPHEVTEVFSVSIKHLQSINP